MRLAAQAADTRIMTCEPSPRMPAPMTLVRVAASLLVFWTAPAARASAQTPTQSTVVDLPRIEAGVSASFIRSTGDTRRWRRAGFDLAAMVKLSDRLHVVVRIEPPSGTGKALLAGARLSTPFFYGSDRDPTPGRFFLQILIGRASPAVSGGGPIGRAIEAVGALDVGGGADVLISRVYPIAVHWQTGYRVGVPRLHGAEGRVEIGLLFGPRLRPIRSRADARF
jgi:hypothetical protein